VSILAYEVGGCQRRRSWARGALGGAAVAVAYYVAAFRAQAPHFILGVEERARAGMAAPQPMQEPRDG